MIRFHEHVICYRLLLSKTAISFHSAKIVWYLENVTIETNAYLFLSGI
jgi:hypothetical protein